MDTVFISVTPAGAFFGPSLEQATTPADILTSQPDKSFWVKLDYLPKLPSTLLTINGENFGAHTQPYDVAHYIGRASSSINPQRMQEFVAEQLLTSNGWIAQ